MPAALVECPHIRILGPGGITYGGAGMSRSPKNPMRGCSPRPRIPCPASPGIDAYEADPRFPGTVPSRRGTRPVGATTPSTGNTCARANPDGRGPNCSTTPSGAGSCPNPRSSSSTNTGSRTSTPSSPTASSLPEARKTSPAASALPEGAATPVRLGGHHRLTFQATSASASSRRAFSVVARGTPAVIPSSTPRLEPGPDRVQGSSPHRGRWQYPPRPLR